MPLSQDRVAAAGTTASVAAAGVTDTVAADGMTESDLASPEVTSGVQPGGVEAPALQVPG